MRNGHRTNTPRKLTLAKVIAYAIIATIILLPMMRLVNGTEAAVREAQIESN
jgi:hypothetical protein